MTGGRGGSKLPLLSISFALFCTLRAYHGGPVGAADCRPGVYRTKGLQAMYDEIKPVYSSVVGDKGSISELTS